MTCSPLTDHRPPAWPGEGEGATLTSVPIGGFVKHQHGIIHLKQSLPWWTHKRPGYPPQARSRGSHTHVPLVQARLSL